MRKTFPTITASDHVSFYPSGDMLKQYRVYRGHEGAQIQFSDLQCPCHPHAIFMREANLKPPSNSHSSLAHQMLSRPYISTWMLANL